MSVRRDGRAIRAERFRLAVLKAAKELLKAGVLRPTMIDVAKVAGVSPRCAFDHFKSIDALLTEAILDGHVREHVANFVCCFNGPPQFPPDQLAMVKAIVLGRV